MAGHHRAELVVDALQMAAGRGELKHDCLMRSDRESEYTSGEFRREIRKLNLKQSKGGKSPNWLMYDNVAAESFLGLLKAETGTTVWDPIRTRVTTSSASSRSNTTAPDSASTPSSGTSPHSKRNTCCNQS